MPVYGFNEAMVSMISARVNGARLIRPCSRPIWGVSGSVAPQSAGRVVRRIASVGRGMAGRAAVILAIR